MAKTPPDSVHTAQLDADNVGVKTVPAALGLKGRHERRSERAVKRSRLALADGSATALQHRFEAAVFDWDGTAVSDRQADASELRELFAELLAAGFDLAVITGTNIGNVDGQLALRPQGPGRIIVACNRGSAICWRRSGRSA